MTFLLQKDTELSWIWIALKYVVWSALGAGLMALLFFTSPGVLSFGALTSVLLGAAAGLGFAMVFTGINELRDEDIRDRYMQEREGFTGGGRSLLFESFGSTNWICSVARVGKVMLGVALLSPMLWAFGVMEVVGGIVGALLKVGIGILGGLGAIISIHSISSYQTVVTPVEAQFILAWDERDEAIARALWDSHRSTLEWSFKQGALAKECQEAAYYGWAEKLAFVLDMGCIEAGHVFSTRSYSQRSYTWTLLTKTLYYLPSFTYHHEPIVRLLIDRGADVNAAEGYGGNTPLHCAVEFHGEPENIGKYYANDIKVCIGMLLAAGADPTLKDKNGKTAAQLAEKKGRHEITSLLRAAVEKREQRGVAVSGEAASSEGIASRLQSGGNGGQAGGGVGGGEGELVSPEAIAELVHQCTCPITDDIMLQPAKASNGVTYERAAILQWFRVVGLYDPMTGEAMSSDQLTFDNVVDVSTNQLYGDGPLLPGGSSSPRQYHINQRIYCLRARLRRKQQAASGDKATLGDHGMFGGKTVNDAADRKAIEAHA